MNDARQFAIALVRLEALRRHVPSYVEEQRVRDFHTIVDALQAASGEDLADFRIPDNEVKRTVIGASRGSYGGGPGRVTYSDKKYCDQDYFKRQIDGLWQYVQTIKTSDAPRTDERKDYWSMSNSELEQLAIKYNIPQISRTGKQSEHWFIDRDRIIDALTKRDKALQAGTTAPQAANVVHVERMYGSAIQQGTHGSSAVVNFKAKETDLRNLLTQIDGSVDQLGLSPEDKTQLQVDIGTINIQLSAATPKSSVISECVHSIRAILEHAAGHALAITFLSHLSGLGI